MIKVINDYLQPDELKAIQDLMYEHKFWSYDPFKVRYNDIEEDDLRDGQFNHGFFNSATLEQSEHMDKLFPILWKAKPLAIYRIKANFEKYGGEKKYESEWHWDWQHQPAYQDDPIPCKNMQTAIFYVNSNNGYTEFETGECINSLANRMVIFPSNIKHRGVTATNAKERFVINFNWFIPELDKPKSK